MTSDPVACCLCVQLRLGRSLCLCTSSAGCFRLVFRCPLPGPASSLGWAPRGLLVDNLLTQPPCCLNSSSVWKFRKHGFSGGWNVWLPDFSDLTGQVFCCFPGCQPCQVSWLTSRKCFLLRKKKKKKVFFPVSAHVCPVSVLRCCNKTSCFCRVFRLMSCWQTGQWEDGRVCRI